MNLSLSPDKCDFLMKAVTFLIHSISLEGIQVDSNKIVIIKRVPHPKKQRDVRGILGLASYYRRFIKYFSKVVAPFLDFWPRTQISIGQVAPKRP